MKNFETAAQQLEAVAGAQETCVALAQRLQIVLALEAQKGSNGGIPHSHGLEYLMRGVFAIVRDGEMSPYAYEQFRDAMHAFDCAE